MRLQLACWIVLGTAGVGLTVGCGGTKRPPAVSVATPDGPDPSPPPFAERIGDGADISPLSDDDPNQVEWPANGSWEDSPLADVYFGYDLATLSDEARATLEQHALWLQTNRSVNIVVEGHCDERGTVEYNLALGAQRADTVKEYLVSLGVSSRRLRTVSYGKERPADAGHDERAWARNRRAHFSVAR